jgi:predicted enzyme related to lactoylglutathione lyase
MKHSVVHLEIPADDVDRARAFYTQLFDWQFSTSPEHEGYWTVDVGAEEAAHGVGMMARQAPEHLLVNYHQVESVAEYAARVEELGGKVIMPKSPVPGMGWFAQCLDTEGNAFGLWETDTAAA